MMRRFILVLAITLAAAMPARAAEPAPVVDQTPSEEAIAAALPLFESDGLEEQLLSSVLHMAQMGFEAEIDQLKAKEIEFPDELLAKVHQLTFEEANGMVKDLMPTIRLEAATIYARYFSVEELKELKILMEHPVMRKAEKVSPQMMAELARIGVKAAAARQPALERKITEVVEQWFADEAQAENPGT